MARSFNAQRKEVSNIVPELERRVAAMTQAVQEAQNQVTSANRGQEGKNRPCVV